METTKTIGSRSNGQRREEKPDEIREEAPERGLVEKTSGERTLSAEQIARVLYRADAMKHADDYAQQRTMSVQNQIPLGENLPVSVLYEIAENSQSGRIPREYVDRALKLECPSPKEMKETLYRIGSNPSSYLRDKKLVYNARIISEGLAKILQNKLPDKTIIVEYPEFESTAESNRIIHYNIRKRRIFGFEIPFFAIRKEVVHAFVFGNSIHLGTHEAAESYVELSDEMKERVKIFSVSHDFDPDREVNFND